jgi:hypothetical protein
MPGLRPRRGRSLTSANNYYDTMRIFIMKLPIGIVLTGLTLLDHLR